jgi:DNA repair exonuclease SbcCD ATPase subunit
MTSTLIRNGAGEEVDSPNPSDASIDLLADFRAELQQLSTAQRELLQDLHSDSETNLESDELPSLRRENEELRARIAQLERTGRDSPTGDDVWAERQAEYEGLLEEKTSVIRELHAKLQQCKENGTSGDASPQEIHDAAVERMKRELAEQRSQLEEDETAMMQQMRTMEMALAKDRAELARQRTELQRQQADFTREIESASRDPQLRDRLASLRRRPNDHASKQFAEGTSATTPPPAPKSSGLIRRIFG